MLREAIAAELPAMRATAESLMIDWCEIRTDGDLTYDPDTKTYTDAADTLIYDGKCQVRLSESLTVQDAIVGDVTVATERIMVKIPIDAPAIPVNAIVQIVDVGNLSDEQLVGQRYRVAGHHAQTYATARRLPCERVTP